MVHFNFGIICDDKIILYNNNKEDYSSRISNSTYLVNVDVELCRHNVLSLEADKVFYDLYLGNGRVFENDWKYQPHESEIQEGKKYIWSKKKSRYVNSGWVKRADKEHISVVLINYKITIIKD